MMLATNVKELKARLSAFLREVERGETVLVTDRGKVIARLMPLAGGLDAVPDEHARLLAAGVRPPR